MLLGKPKDYQGDVVMNKSRWLIAAIVGIGIASPAIANPAAAPKGPPAEILAATCSTCHGVDGTGSGPIPAIKGRPAVLLESQLKGFKSGELPSTVMGRLAKGFSDTQLEALAKHFGAQ